MAHNDSFRAENRLSRLCRGLRVLRFLAYIFGQKPFCVQNIDENLELFWTNFIFGPRAVCSLKCKGCKSYRDFLAKPRLSLQFLHSVQDLRTVFCSFFSAV